MTVDLSVDDLVEQGLLDESGGVSDGVVSDMDDVDPDDKKEEAEAETEGPISTKDGKGQIPFDVLKKTRERAQYAEAELESSKDQILDLTRQMEDLRALVQSGKISEEQAQEQASNIEDQIGDIDPDEYEEEFGEEIGNLAKLTANLLKQNKFLASEVQEVKEYASHKAAQDNSASATQIKDAIDNNPKLTEWQETDRDRWDKAVEIDEFLTKDPDYAALSYSERFEKTVSMVESLMGKSDGGEILSKAEEAVASSKSKPVTSLSHVEGGTTGDKTGVAALTEMSVSDLDGMMSKMSPKQLETWLAENV